MGSLSTALEVAQTLASILHIDDGSMTIGEARDMICYSEEYQGLRSYLHEMDITIDPHSPIKVEMIDGGILSVTDTNINSAILTIYYSDHSDLDFPNMTEDDMLALVYSDYWDEVSAHFSADDY